MQARKVAYNKPIAIIYNPNSGKKINLIPIIEQRLKAEGIPYELLATEKFFDTFEYARDIDLAKYSILVACGGDGSVHEVTNGMMARKDGLKIPIAIIPNGSGNDMAKSLGVSNVDNALDYIVSRTVIRADCFKALVDHEDEGDIPVDQKWQYCRYFNNSCSFGMPPKIAINAKPFKACCGTGSYKIAAIKLGILCQTDPDSFVIKADGETVTSNDQNQVDTTMLFCMNSKNLGAMVLNPFGIINDGLLDVCWVKDPNEFGLGGVGRMLDAGAKGGLGVYMEGAIKYTRGKHYRIENNREAELLFNIDGEDWNFNNYVKLETIPNGIEYLFDANNYYQEFKSFM